MEFRWDVAAFVLIFVVIVVMLVRQSMKARALEAEKASSSDSPNESMLLKFVEDETGARVGETVASSGDKMIVKSPQGFLAVPAANLTDTGAGLKITGSYDVEAAKKAGDEWREKSHKVITYDPKELPPEDRPEG